MGAIGKLIIEKDATLKDVVEKAKTLSPFAVDIRYSGEDDPPSVNEAKEKLDIAKLVYEEILKRLPAEVAKQKTK